MSDCNTCYTRELGVFIVNFVVTWCLCVKMAHAVFLTVEDDVSENIIVNQRACSDGTLMPLIVYDLL